MNSYFDSGANWSRKLFSDSSAARITASILLLLFVTGFIFMSALQVTRLFLRDEAGYDDSYILYDVWSFQRSGVIYPDLTQPPYLPAAYSPLLYVLYAVPGKITTNPFFGPRLVALTSFLLCIAVAVSLVRILIPGRFVWPCGFLIASSIKIMELWPLQLRGDLPAAFFGLLSIRLLLSQSPWLILLAGLCAGLPLQFKINYLAALAAGSLWLALQKHWKGLGVFLAGGVLGLVPFLFFGLREPRMVSQLLLFFPPVRDVPGCLKLILKVLREPVALLGLSAMPFVIFRRWPRWWLLAMFIVFSFVLASLTAVQVGANVNYFFELLFALTPFAVLGSFRLIEWSRRSPGLALSAAVLVVLFCLVPPVFLNSGAFGRLRDADPRRVALLNRDFQTMEAVLGGRHLLSTNPRIALLDPHPALVEPWLVSHLRRLGKFDPAPLLSSIRNSEFEIVDVDTELRKKDKAGWRGIGRLEGDDFRSAVEIAYRPECSVFGRILRLPRNRPRDEALIQQLHNIGCVPE